MTARVLCASLALAAMAAQADVASNVYTVVVNGGTLAEPVSIEGQQVEIYDAEADTTTTAEFGSFAFAPNSIFRKRGSGWMMSSVKMAAFTGEIRIEEGAFMVNTNLMTGPLNLTTAPTVVVSNGATFAIAATDATCPAPNTSLSDAGLHLFNHFHLIGKGVDNLGAIANCLGNNQQYLFRGDWTLDGDTMLSGTSNKRYDMTTSPSINMNGYTLTVKRGTAGGWNFCSGSAVYRTPGHIVVDGTSIQPQGAATWPGSAENTLTLTNNSTYGNYNTVLKSPWTLVCENGTTISPSGSTANYSDFSAGTNKYNFWNGPAVFNGTTTIASGSFGRGFSFNGPISGGGTLVTRSCWLQLTRPGPDFTGVINVNDNNGIRNAGLAMYCGDVAPNAAGITLANAELRLVNNVRYDLPKMEFSNTRSNQLMRLPVTGYIQDSHHPAAKGSTAAGLKMSGTKELRIEGDLSVTGVLEVTQGRLTLYGNPHAGFITGQSGPVGNASSLANNTTPVYANSVVLKPLQAYSSLGNSIGKSNCVTWAGYIWNRSATNETWTFAFAVAQGTRFDFRGTKIMWDYDFFAKKRLLFYTFNDVAPGPNKIMIRTYGSQSSGGWPVEASRLTNAVWRNSFGMAIDRLGRNSRNWQDYEEIADPGDGSLITVSDDGSLPSADPEWNVAFSHLKLAPDGELDANGRELSLKTVEGVGKVLNGAGYFKGRLSISDSWTVSAAQIAAGGCLSVTNGAIAFGSGCVLKVEDILPGTLSHSEEYVIARATDGIDGLPVPSATEPGGKYWKAQKSVESSGASVLKLFWRRGFVMSFR